MATMSADAKFEKGVKIFVLGFMTVVTTIAVVLGATMIF